MKNLKFMNLFLVVMLVMFLFVGCLPTVPEMEPEEEVEIVEEAPGLPIGVIFKIVIEPNNPTVSVGDSITLTLHAYDYPEMEEVYLDGSKITWSDNCEEDVLSPLVGLSTVYTANGEYNASHIRACYKWPYVEGCPEDGPHYLCTGININVVE